MDVFSKFAWAYPLKNKTGISITDAFNDIIKSIKENQNISGWMKGLNCMIKLSKNGLTKMILTCILLFMKEKPLLLRDSIEH